MKVIEPGNRPDDQPEIEPRRHQRHRIERAEDQADRDLAADEARQHPVDIAREAADHVAVVARQPAVDLGDHVVPVEQQVEGHDRHDDDEHDRVDHRQAAEDRSPPASSPPFDWMVLPMEISVSRTTLC